MPASTEGQVTDLEQSSTKTEDTVKSSGYGRAINLSFDEEPATESVVHDTDEDVSEPDESDTVKKSKKGQTDDEDSDDESEDQESNEDDDAREKNRKGYQERQRKKLDLYEARQKAEDAVRETEELRRRLDALERGERPSKNTKDVQTELPSHLQKEPDPDDFDTHAAYTRAVARHENAIIKWEDEQATVKSKISERQQNIKTKLSNAVNAALEKYDDFLDLTDGQPQKATPEVIEYLENVDELVVSEILYYFGQHPDEYEKIIKSGPIAAARALAKIEGKFEGNVSTVKKVIKSADLPAPIKPLSGSGGRKQSALEDKNSTYRDVRKELIALKKR